MALVKTFRKLPIIFAMLNVLMKKGIIGAEVARDLIEYSLPDEMSKLEKETIIDSLVNVV